MHNEGNSTYQGTSAFSAVPGVNNDTSGGTQAPADNTQQTQPPANNSGGDNSDSTPAVQIIPAEAVLIILLPIPVVRIIPAETTTPTEMADDHS